MVDAIAQITNKIKSLEENLASLDEYYKQRRDNLVTDILYLKAFINRNEVILILREARMGLKIKQGADSGDIEYEYKHITWSCYDWSEAPLRESTFQFLVREKYLEFKREWMDDHLMWHGDYVITAEGDEYLQELLR